MATQSRGRVIIRIRPKKKDLFTVHLRRVGFLFFALLISCKAHAHSSLSRERVLSIEVMGRSCLYGPQYDQRIGKAFALGIGLSRIEVQESKRLGSKGSFLIPMFSHYYFNTQRSSVYLSVGVTGVVQPKNVEDGQAILGRLSFSSLPFLPNVGLGYELRQDQGFLFRLAGLITQGKSLALSSGLHLGYLF